MKDIMESMPAMAPEATADAKENTAPPQTDTIGLTDVAAENIEIINTTNGVGLALTDASGITAVTTKTSRGAMTKILINNTANMRDVEQFVHFDMTVTGFNRFTGNLRQALQMNQMQRGLAGGGQLRP